MREYMLRLYHERMAKAREQLGGRCVRCGETEDLDFDHVDRKQKSFTIGMMWSLSEVKFQAELMKCQLLCHDCHNKKTTSEVRAMEFICACGKTWIGLQRYRGHRRWCSVR